MLLILRRVKYYLAKIIFQFDYAQLINHRRASFLMEKFKVDEYGHEANHETSDLGYGWIHYGLIRGFKPKRILCVGSRHGFLPAILAQACKDNSFGKVDFVDAGFSEDEKGGWTGVGYWRTPQGKESFLKAGLGVFITLFVTTTEKFAKRYPNNRYDYIYIDGDHSLKGVLLDFKLFWPMLNSGGLMAFHDISVKEEKAEGVYGVWKFWSMVEEKFGGVKVDFVGSGLGILQKKV